MIRNTIIAIMFTSFIYSEAEAQKKVTPVSESALTGIKVPSGSRKDARGISLLAAKTLIDLEAKKAGIQMESTEILYLPIASNFGRDSLTLALNAFNWQALEQYNHEEYLWFQKDAATLIVYYEKDKTDINLYFAISKSASNIAAPQPAPVFNPPPVENNPPVQPPAQQDPPPTAFTPVNTTVSNTGNFTFWTTNFDDGWTATIKEDWVEVSKGSIKAYLFFTQKNDLEVGKTSIEARDYFWEKTAVRYFNTTTKSYRDPEFAYMFKPNYVEGYGRDPQTGQQVFVAMFVVVNSGVGEVTIVTAASESEIRQAFPKANDNNVSDIPSMRRYNKFAIAAADIVGSWIDGSDTQAMEWYTVGPGGGSYAGMSVAARSASFQFNNNGTYQSHHNGATGMIGNLSTFEQNYKGKLEVSNWKVVMSNRWQDKTEEYDAYFIAVKGGRILRLAQGTGMDYKLMKEK